MADGLDAASFEFYEGIQIILPGALALGLVYVTFRSFTSTGAGIDLNAASAVFAALLLGLLFYFVDAPAKAAVFQPLQPTDLLISWGKRPREGVSTLNAYFVMLDTVIPAPIRARALYMGSMYRIGFEAVYMLLTWGLVILTAPSWSTMPADTEWASFTWDMWVTAAVFVSAWVYTARRERRSSKRSRRLDDVATVSFSKLDVLILTA